MAILNAFDCSAGSIRTMVSWLILIPISRTVVFAGFFGTQIQIASG